MIIYSIRSTSIRTYDT